MEKLPLAVRLGLVRDSKVMGIGAEDSQGRRRVSCDSKNCKKYSKYIGTIVEDAYGYTIVDGDDYSEDVWNNTYHDDCPQDANP